MRSRAVKREVRTGIRAGDAVIMRVSCNLARCVEPMLRRNKHPFAVEVVADPYDGFSPGALEHPLRPFFRWYFTRHTRRQCQGACAATYVTRGALQRRYPPSPHAFATYYSDVVLAEESSENPGPRQTFPRGERIRLIMVGGLERLYKAPDVLIDAVGRCVAQGLDIELAFVGDGQLRGMLEQDAASRGLSQRIHFLGALPAGDCVRRELDQADLFVLPSRQEGLPRAMIEAMAQGLPCIGSTIGGIPELLQADEMVPPGDADALARKIGEVVQDHERMKQMSVRNIDGAKEYREEVLCARRREFYARVRRITEERFGEGSDRITKNSEV
jgi:glycosyltransferase involved in cell wall biosynthesis